MPRRLLGIFILLLVSVFPMQAQGDAVLFTVGSDTVCLGEFEYRLGRSLDKRGHVLLQTWARLKQKVQWAKELGLDTLEAYRQQRNSYLCRLVADVETNSDERSVSSVREWVRLQHVTIPLTQRAGKKEGQEAKKQLESLYQAAEKREKIVLETLPWTQTRHLLGEWQKQLAELERGEYSRPFMSPLGVHVIRWTDKRLEKPRQETAIVSANTYRQKEMEDALLLVHLEDYLERTLKVTEADLKNYFSQHRKDYGWGTPHYRGAVIHCQNKQDAKRIKKYLKKYPESQWEDAWKQMPDDVSQGCLMEIGLFAIGTNPYVDKLAFKCGTFEPLADYPYTWVMGKKLKKGPTDYTDVRMQLEKDCRIAQKEAETEAFIQKYQVEINEEVLKTVNHDGIK